MSEALARNIILRIAALLMTALLCAMFCSCRDQRPTTTPEQGVAQPIVEPTPEMPAALPLPATVGLEGAPVYVAGEVGPDLVLRLTAGEAGLPTGTLLRVTLPGESWSVPQLERGEDSGYISCKISGSEPLITIHARGTGRIPSRSRSVVDVELTADLATGEPALLRYVKPRVQPTAGRVAIRAQLRLPGNTEPLELESPSLNVEPGPMVWVRVLAPSDVIVGQPFSVRLRPLDRLGNLARAQAGRYNLELMRPGNTAGREVDLLHPQIEWTVDQPTSGWFTLFAQDGSVAGRAQPLIAHQAQPQYVRAWADLSFHSGLSDAYAPIDPGQAFAYARDVSGLDLACLTDHAEGIWSDPLSSEEFRRSVAEAQRASTPQFLALAGFTWTGSFFWDQEYPEGPGHAHVLPLGEVVEPCRADLEQCDEPQELFAQLDGADAVAIWEHSLTQWGAADFSALPLPTKLAPLVQIYSYLGSNECVDCKPRQREGTGDSRHSVQAALVRGEHVGFSASSNSLYGHPGLGRFPGYAGPEEDAGGLTCLLVSERGKSGYLEAIRARRSYATTGIRPLIDFSCAGAPMGGRAQSDGPPQCRLAVTCAANIESIEIVRGGAGCRLPLESVLNSRPDARSAAFDWIDRDFDGAAFYYLRVTDVNGERAWTSPIWVDSAPQPEATAEQ
ncbi:MAG: hypothetical protein P9M14_10860 [Candidatus Alcyoniella australis]|nr:hypothetical protein [Candidatus Alcyoniella australis]